MRDAFARTSQAKIRQVIMRTCFIRGSLTTKQSRKVWIGLDDDIQLLLWNDVDARQGKAAGGGIHQGVSDREPEHRARQCEIHDLAGAVIEKHGQCNPPIEDDESGRTLITLHVQMCTNGKNPSIRLEIENPLEFLFYIHATSP